MVPEFFGSLVSVLEPETFVLMLIGIAVGFVVGILPGLGGSVALALMIPFTYDMDPVQAVAFLLSMHVVSATTGDITSVLFGIPGEATTAATVLDGYPMTRRGEAGRALGAALFSSALGAVLGAIVLALAVPVLRPFVLSIGPPEFFMLTVLGLTFVVSLSNGKVLKGFLMAAFGLIVSMVGLDPQLGEERYTFGQIYLWDGIGLVPLVIGLFGGAELLQMMLSRATIASGTRPPNPYTGILQGIRETFVYWSVVLRSSIIGILIGAVPGMGGSVSQFIAYGQAQQTSKHPELFGKGSIEGVIAAGANNNAKDSGSLIPTLAFGIPGSVGTAVLLGGLLVAGITPGPEMLTTNVGVTFSMVWITVISNIIVVALSILLLGQIVKVTFVNSAWLVPGLLALLGLGAYTATTSFADVIVMLVASVVGVAAIHWNWPRVPFLLAAVLGGLMERYLFLSYSLHGWSWLGFKPVMFLTACVFLAALLPLLRYYRERRRRATPAEKSSAGVSR
jgi:TctA family transporter